MSDFVASKFLKELSVTDSFFYTLTEVIKRGKNQLLQKRFAESMVIDGKWIETIDNYLYSVEKIVKKPRSFIKEDGIIVPVEKAKRTDSETIRHLAANSNLVRSIDERGNVIPIKVLTKEMNEDTAIYENRFVHTLINRLSDFIDQKYISISQIVDAYDTTAIELDSDFDLSNTAVSFKMSLDIKNRSAITVVQEQNYQLLEELKRIQKRLVLIRASAFYKKLSNTKPITPPIMKTNILRMDTDYKNAYSLWLFMSSFTSVGYSIQLDEKRMPIDGDYYDDLTALIGISLKTVLENNNLREDEYRNIAFKRKNPKKFRIKKSLEHEIKFNLGELVDEKDLVNQYYYERIKELVRKSELNALKQSESEVKRKKRTTFRSFYRELNNLNNGIYREMLNLDLDDIAPPARAKSKQIGNKEVAYKKQQELYKRHRQLSRLKLADLDRTLKEETVQLVRLERLKDELAALKAKEAGRKPRKVSAKSLENLKNLRPKLLEDAAMREMQLISELRAKQAAQAEAAKKKELDRKLRRISPANPKKTDT